MSASDTGGAFEWITRGRELKIQILCNLRSSAVCFIGLDDEWKSEFRSGETYFLYDLIWDLEDSFLKLVSSKPRFGFGEAKYGACACGAWLEAEMRPRSELKTSTCAFGAPVVLRARTAIEKKRIERTLRDFRYMVLVSR